MRTMESSMDGWYFSSHERSEIMMSFSAPSVSTFITCAAREYVLHGE